MQDSTRRLPREAAAALPITVVALDAAAAVAAAVKGIFLLRVLALRERPGEAAAAASAAFVCLGFISTKYSAMLPLRCVVTDLAAAAAAAAWRALCWGIISV
ncbi:hypothetical protein Emed_005507 [Eimeria media]